MKHSTNKLKGDIIYKLSIFFIVIVILFFIALVLFNLDKEYLHVLQPYTAFDMFALFQNLNHISIPVCIFLILFLIVNGFALYTILVWWIMGDEERTEIRK